MTAISGNHATFTLKLTGIDLQNIHPNDVGVLLSEFADLLDNDSLKFGNVRTGSVVVELEADPALYTQILQNFSENRIKSAYKTIQKTIKKLAKQFPDIQAQFLARPNANTKNQLIYTIDYQEEVQYITQAESIIGRLIKPAQGKDNTDHFTIILANDKNISVKVNKSLSHQLAPYLQTLWLGESLIEFSGIAKYEMNGFKSTLKEFTASHFNIIDNQQNINNWVNEFIAFGKSGWQSLENPLETWIEERH